MSNFYRLIFPFLDLLLRRSHTLNIVFGIVLGMFLGLFPMGTLQWIVSIAAFIFFRVNLLVFLLVFFTSLAMGFLLDPVWNSLGFRLLTNRTDLYPVWGWMSHAPILPFTEFNNTVVLGATLSALFLAPSLVFLYLAFRAPLRTMLSKLWYQTKMSRFYAHYRKI